MITLGIDLAAEAAGTWSCTLDWSKKPPRVTELLGGLGNPGIIDRIARTDLAGVDCPLGWPDPFVEAVSAHARGGPWPGRDASDERAFRRSLCLRRMDLAVHDATGIPPLSVSADKLGRTAMRCALLQDALASGGRAVDRAGVSGPLVEVYPRTALQSWGLPWRLYKRPEAVHVRDAIVTGLVNEARIMVSTDVRAQLVAIHDALDPLVCALVARAARLGLTSRPAEGAEIESARREGWIHTPSADALERLSGG